MSHEAFHNPVRLQFGEGCLSKIAAIVRGRRYLLVTHAGNVAQAWCERIVGLCGKPVQLLNTVTANPTLDILRDQCAAMATSCAQVDVIVAIGGGSVIDTAKFLAAGRGYYQAVINRMQGGQHLSAPALPIIAVPTTAGTGSDLTKWATVWDMRGNRKLSLEADDLYPEASFVDPVLTYTQPWSITLASGLDALSHALESVWNINANICTRTLAVAASKDVLAALPVLKRNPICRSARRRMAMGATRAGLAFSATRTAIAHNISYPLTIEQGVAHGIACSFSLPEVMEAAIGVDARCDAALMEIFGPLTRAPQHLRAFLNKFDIPRSAQAFGVDEHQWLDIVTSAAGGERGKNFIGYADRLYRSNIPN